MVQWFLKQNGLIFHSLTCRTKKLKRRRMKAVMRIRAVEIRRTRRRRRRTYR